MSKGPENLSTIKLVALLEKTARKNKARVWLEVARLLKKSRRSQREISIARLDKVTHEGDVAAVLSKVLGEGEITHKMTIGLLKASASARKKLAESESKGKNGCVVVSLRELVEKNPAGKGVKIIV